MMILFKDEKGKVLAEYNSFISEEEINSTKELLEHENKCIVKVFIEPSIIKG